MNSPHEDPVTAQELGRIVRMRREGAISPSEACGLGEVVRALTSPATRERLGGRINADLNEEHPNSIAERDPEGNLRQLFHYDIRNPLSVREARDWLVKAYANGELAQGTYALYRPLLDDVLANP